TISDFVNALNGLNVNQINRRLTRLAQNPQANPCIVGTSSARANTFANRRAPALPLPLRYHVRDVNPIAFNSMRDVLQYARTPPAQFTHLAAPMNIVAVPPRHRDRNAETALCACLPAGLCNNFA